MRRRPLVLGILNVAVLALTAYFAAEHQRNMALLMIAVFALSFAVSYAYVRTSRRRKGPQFQIRRSSAAYLTAFLFGMTSVMNLAYWTRGRLPGVHLLVALLMALIAIWFFGLGIATRRAER